MLTLEGTIDVELEGFASIVRYKRNLYKWSENMDAYVPIDAIPVRKVKAKNDPSLISADDISGLKRDINAVEHLSCSVRNRDGKQYLTVKSLSPKSYDEIKRYVEPLLRIYAPKAHHTSGSWSEHTYRLNPTSDWSSLR
jgi:hypothetical protein